MAGLKEVRGRIGSVRSTRKITSAMKMVSAAKFHRAQLGYDQYQLFLREFQRMLSLALSQGVKLEHPLMRSTKGDAPTLVLAFTSNSSMCGGYNNAVAQLVREEIQRHASEKRKCDVWAYGRKGADMLSKEGVRLGKRDEGLVDKPSYEEAMVLYDELQRNFEKGEYSQVFLAYNQFHTAASQEPVLRRLFPIEMPELDVKGVQDEYIFEPTTEEFFAYALPNYTRLLLFGALQDNAIGEHGARMTAMMQATDNADALLDDLTLEYNKARQSAITNELVEIVSGADALNG